MEKNNCNDIENKKPYIEKPGWIGCCGKKLLEPSCTPNLVDDFCVHCQYCYGGNEMDEVLYDEC